MKRAVIALLGILMVVGLLATPVASTPVSEPTAIAQADSYTRVKHACDSQAYRLDIRTKWGSGTYYTHTLDRCETGPTGVNGGHIPTGYYMSSGWCAEHKAYNNGYLTDRNYTCGPGWKSLIPNRYNVIRAYPVRT